MRPESLDILLPCFNPKSDWVDTLHANVEKIKSALPKLNINFIIVDDGSTPSISEDLKVISQLDQFKTISHNTNRGKGSAIRAAAKLSNSDIIVYTDIDFPYTTESLLKVVEVLDQGNTDVVVAIRNDEYYQKIPPSRKRISLMLKNVNRYLMKLVTADTQCGLKGMNIKGKEKLLNTSIDRYLFDLEFVKMISKDTNIRKKLVHVELRENVSFSRVPISKLLQELRSYFAILLFR